MPPTEGPGKYLCRTRDERDGRAAPLEATPAARRLVRLRTAATVGGRQADRSRERRDVRPALRRAATRACRPQHHQPSERLQLVKYDHLCCVVSDRVAHFFGRAT